MNWKASLKYVLYCFVSIMATIIGLGIIGFSIGISRFDIPNWANILERVITWIILLAIFAHMAKERFDNEYVHAIFVAICLWLVFFPVGVLIFKFPYAQWKVSFVEYFLTALIGTLIGKYLIRRKERRT